MTYAFRSPAKINPHLRVVGRRADGYHELRVLFQTIDLSDRLEFASDDLAQSPDSRGRQAPTVQVEYVEASTGGTLDLGVAPGQDLVSRAVAAFAQHWGPIGSWRVRVEKAIPRGGGLGGGSSNAATTLLALREMTAAPVAVEELEPVARTLGADVPFFLHGGFAAGTARGDILELLEDGPEEELFLAIPPPSLSTAEVFRWFAERGADRPPNREWPEALALWRREGRGGAGLRLLGGENDLEAVVCERSEVVAAVYAALIRQGVGGVRMTGSGACCFGFPAGSHARTPTLPEGLGSVLRVRTLPRRALGAFRRIC